MTRRRSNSSEWAERGSATVELPFVLGLIVMPFALVVLQLPRWVEYQQAANDAAAEVARSHATGSDSEQADELLGLIESSHGLSPGSLGAASVTPGAAGGDLVVEVTVELPVLSFGSLGTLGATTWTARHVERRADFGSETE